MNKKIVVYQNGKKKEYMTTVKKVKLDKIMDSKAVDKIMNDVSNGDINVDISK